VDVNSGNILFDNLVSDEISIQEKIKSRLKSRNNCYQSVLNPLSSSLLSKNIKIKIHRIIILPVVWYGCETWSLILEEKRRLSVSETMVLRRIYGPKREEGTEDCTRLHNEKLNDTYCSPNITRLIKSRRMRWAGHVACKETRQVHTGVWWRDLRERDTSLDWRVILKWIF
jgi:hypothetical protein